MSQLADKIEALITPEISPEAAEFMRKAAEVERQRDSSPPSNPNPGERWGAYEFNADGFWRLVPLNP